ncbi:MAG: hypothetical protein A3F83_17145 [Candidatus Glassbacteria bacterium RIFCSPLOWO2_12_FULL_58_11]|uniref:OmpA-like domain-containing protein n=1 Tax=Candidatus Glassbacteria bacterium RIFCSPLOWO2_12_FULL_58_11 TaxID=1817867 RepID=A0A1F5YYP1_9BACT|nr:MAG: hypothetical protein A3F83_17145 [Candidatus Glassbacteria bacterium RIFCSPLOWO2_12_FULL_58_11]
MGKSKCECPDSPPAWLTTFSDLMSLLLCFFVLLVSMSHIREDAYYVARGSLEGAFGVMSSNPAMIRLGYTPMPTLKNIQRAIVDESVSNLQDFIQGRKMGDDVKVVISDKGVSLSISAPLLFDSGRSDLKPDMYPLLSQVFDIARGWPNVIRVEGHTDNTPIESAQYESNWDLSFARALSVVQFAVQFSKIHPSRLAPVACGEYRPVADNTTEEGRAKNRRIEIMMEYKKENENPFK